MEKIKYKILKITKNNSIKKSHVKSGIYGNKYRLIVNIGNAYENDLPKYLFSLILRKVDNGFYFYEEVCRQTK